MKKDNFWSMMNKGLKVNNNYQSTRRSSVKETREADLHNHKYKEDIGGNESNYKR